MTKFEGTAKVLLLLLMLSILSSAQTSKVLQGTKDSANYLTLESEPSSNKLIYRLLSYNHDLLTSVGNPNAFSKV